MGSFRKINAIIKMLDNEDLYKGITETMDKK